MKEIQGKELMRAVKHLCGGSIDVVDIHNERNLTILDACLNHEIQYRKRSTMIKILKARIKKLGKNQPSFPRRRESSNLA